jgi:hypothetical protein
MPVEELADHQPPARLQHPRRRAEHPGRLRHLPERGHQVDGVEHAVVEGQLPRVRAVRHDRCRRVPARRVPARLHLLLHPAHHVVEHLLLHVHDVQAPVRTELRRDVQRLQTGARTEFQHPFTRPRTEHRVQIGQPQEGQLQIQQATL